MLSFVSNYFVFHGIDMDVVRWWLIHLLSASGFMFLGPLLSFSIPHVAKSWCGQPCLGVPGSSLDAAAPKGLTISGAFWVSNPVLVGGEMQKMLDNVGVFFQKLAAQQDACCRLEEPC